MPKTKISEFSATPANNTDIDSINLAEGCAPSGINDAIRELMAQLKDFQTGAVGDSFNGPVGTSTAAAGAFTTLSASSTVSGTGFSTYLASPPAIGGTAAAAVSATTLSASSTLSVTGAGSIQGLTVGRGAGAVSTNTAVGASALDANTTGASNTAVGQNALLVNTDGAQNTAVGRAALTANTSGSLNAAFGRSALLANTSGGNNVAVGGSALASNTTASNNTAVGYQAGYSNTTGTVNVFVGQGAGYTNSTGTGNTFVGRNAGYTSNVSAAGGDALNTCIGYSAGYSLTTGTGNNCIGSNYSGTGAGYFLTTGSRNTILGGYNGNQGGLDIRTASNNIVLSDGDGNPRAYWNSLGSMRVPYTYTDTTASAANVFVASDGQFLRSTSALKYKQDIRNLEDMDISALRPVRYKSKCEGDDQTKDHFGVIADEAADAGFEELITRGATGEVEGFQYERLTVVLLKELQTLRARVAQLESN